jgi:regulatory subunit for Cdc7p protein kinase
VTHLVTNRTLPSEEAIQHPTTTALRWNARTVNPALIDQKTEGRKGTRGTNDVLLKAREWGIKIWATEKLERVLVGLIDVPGRHAVPVNQRNSQQLPITAQTHTNIDLSHVLRNERLHGPTDRDPSVVSKVLHYWKGPYIYVYDMFGIVRPVIMREYPKVQRREEGIWPQFRSVSNGKCPFIEEQVHQRREKQIERPGNVEEKAGGRVEPKAQPQETRTMVEAKMRAKPSTRAAEQHAQTKYVATKAEEDFKERPILKDKSPAKLKTYVGKSKRILAELNHTDTRANSQTVATGPTGDSKGTVLRAENAIAFTSTQESTQSIRRYNVEPAASGVQPSNITSAIRSQMISSHQDQPGQRAGTSKELYALQRKVAGHVLSSNQLSKPATMARRSIDLLAMRSQNDLKTVRKRDAEGKEKATEVEGRKEMGSNSQRAQVTKKKVEPKPGYCENCREKFDDFDEVRYGRPPRPVFTKLTSISSTLLPGAIGSSPPITRIGPNWTLF